MPYYKGSWYSQLPPFGWFDPEDRPGSAAYQVGGRSIPDSQQGIALPSRRTLGKWFNVTPPGGNLPFPMQQTDVGPAPYTGRGVDISAAAAHQMGYTPKNFPTDASWKIEPRDEPRGLGSPAGLPVQAGDIPDNTDETAIAPGPAGARREAQGPKMPTSLMDMFQPTDAGGAPVDLGKALASRSNSLIGLGLGLMGASRPGLGEALHGYQVGAGQDATQNRYAQQLAHQKQQDARQAAQDAFQRSQAAQTQANFERTFNKPQILGSPESGYYLYDPSRAGGQGPQVAGPAGAGAAAGAATGTATGGTAAEDTGAPIRQVLPGQGKAPPAGYEWGSPDPRTGKRPLVGIEGGPATKLPEGTAGRLALLQAAKPGLEEAKKYFLDPRPLLLREGGDQAGGSLYSAGKQAIGEYTGSFEIGRQRRNVRLGVEAALRAATGAAAPEAEVDRYTDMYAPSVRDTYETRKQKIEALDRFITTYENIATRGHGTPTASSPATEPAATPKPGTVQKGYVFKGGDPSKEENWAPVR